MNCVNFQSKIKLLWFIRPVFPVHLIPIASETSLAHDSKLTFVLVGSFYQPFKKKIRLCCRGILEILNIPCTRCTLLVLLSVGPKLEYQSLLSSGKPKHLLAGWVPFGGRCDVITTNHVHFVTYKCVTKTQLV